MIAYLSYSGNTEEVAELMEEQLKRNHVEVNMHRVGISPSFDPEAYDLVFLGTFTWEYGYVPEEMKELIFEIGYKPNHLAVFGTGDTQFGEEEMFCMAVDKLEKFYNSKWPGLKIEQSPRGSQEEKVRAWVEGVLEYDRSFA